MKPSKRLPGIVILSMLLTFSLALPQAVQAGPAGTPVSQAEQPRSTEQRSPVQQLGKPAPATASDEQTKSYRERESRNTEAGNFRAGDAGFYIGGSAGLLIVILLVILILR